LFILENYYNNFNYYYITYIIWITPVKIFYKYAIYTNNMKRTKIIILMKSFYYKL